MQGEVVDRQAVQVVVAQVMVQVVVLQVSVQLIVFAAVAPRRCHSRQRTGATGSTSGQNRTCIHHTR
jgi:hypothetical protein